MVTTPCISCGDKVAVGQAGMCGSVGGWCSSSCGKLLSTIKGALCVISRLVMQCMRDVALLPGGPQSKWCSSYLRCVPLLLLLLLLAPSVGGCFAIAGCCRGVGATQEKGTCVLFAVTSHQVTVSQPTNQLTAVSQLRA